MNYFYLLLISLFLSGCSTTTAIHHIPLNNSNEPKKLAVFFDGTANDEKSNTNIKKLHSLVTLQNKNNIFTTYIKGVGTDKKFIGAATGWGIGHDVREAYQFLGENYSKADDEIYIFGFSRGAYSARILAALVNIAGVVDLSSMTEEKKKEFVIKIYSLYKGSKSIKLARNKISKILPELKIKPARIKFMGLYETVEALGFPDLDENSDVPNERYSDQLCNVDKAAHALAIDDDRARIFTPILLTREHLINKCDKPLNINNIVEEVWFSGAHSDVGGGYADTNIDGITLNWMLSQIDKNTSGLIPKGKRVFADPYGKTHDPEAGLWGLIYRKRNRNIVSMSSAYNNGRLKVHKSVIDRLDCTPYKKHEFDWIKSYKRFFKREGGTLKYNTNVKNNSFEIVSDGYQSSACNSNLPPSTLKPCKTLGGAFLGKGEACYTDIIADRNNNNVGIKLKKDQSYVVKAQTGQKWRDGGRINMPLCGEKGSFLMMFGNKRVESGLWFSVIAEIKGGNTTYDLCTDDKSRGEFTAESSGEMILYANDDKYFYNNNSGVIRVEVHREN